MATLVSVKRITATGDVGVGPARLKYVHAVSDIGGGRLTITDGTGGATLFDADFLASDCTGVTLPDEGLRFANSMVVTAITNMVSVTLVYG